MDVEDSDKAGDRWKKLEPDSANAVYEEATKAAYYFSDWRYKLLTYFLALAVALGATTEWLVQNDRGRWAAVPFAAGYFVSLMLVWMDYRNTLLLRIAHGVAASVEGAWGVGPLPDDPWRVGRDGRAPSAFYSALLDLQPFRASGAWTRRQRLSSYTVTMTVWFVVSAVAFSVGTAVIAVDALTARIGVIAGMVAGIGVFFVATRDVKVRSWPRKPEYGPAP
jgi:hypothetical protein